MIDNCYLNEIKDDDELRYTIRDYTNEYIDNNEYEMSFLILKGSSFQRYGLQKSKGNVQINQ